MIVAQKIRQRSTLRCSCDAVSVVLLPLRELRRHALNSVHGLGNRLALFLELAVALPFLVRLHDGRHMATAVRMPADETKSLRIIASELVANVMEWLAVERVVVGEFDMHANHEVKLHPSCVVRFAVSHVYLRGCEAQSVLVTAAVNARSWVVEFGRIGKRVNWRAVLPDFRFNASE